MCVVSMVGDHFNDRFKDWKDRIQPFDPNIVPQPYIGNPNPLPVIFNGVSQAEFDKLKAEVEHMKQLLIKAKIYDEANGEKDCEMESKVAFLKKIAEAVGVNLDEVFGKQVPSDPLGGEMGA